MFLMVNILLYVVVFSYWASSSQLLSVQVRERIKYVRPEVESSGG